MPTPVIMPKFGMAQEDGTIIRWLKQAGDPVEKGETLLEVQTDKIDMEVEAPGSGILTDVRYGSDATVPVTTVIAYITAPNEAAAPLTPTAPAPGVEAAPPVAPSPEHRVSPVAQRIAAASGVDLTRVAGTGRAGRITKSDVVNALSTHPPLNEPHTSKDRVRSTPAARRLARQHAVDLAKIAGSGPANRIQATDVMAAAALVRPEIALPAEIAADAHAGEPLRGRRRTIATRLSQSWQNVPHIFLTSTIDLTRLDALTAELGAEVEARGGRLTPIVWLARATATALRRQPRLNAWMQRAGDQWVLQQRQEIDLGIAVALDDGLIVPVVRDADQIGLAPLAARIADLAARARAGQVTPDEVSGGTFTISNLGMFPVDHFTAIINPPEVAILAVGRAQMHPVWTGAAFEPRRRVEVTLSADHRAIDGAVAAAFLAELKRLLEEPARLLL